MILLLSKKANKINFTFSAKKKKKRKKMKNEEAIQ